MKRRLYHYSLYCAGVLFFASMLSCTKTIDKTTVLAADRASGTWVEKASLPIAASGVINGRKNATAFTIGQYAYVGLGETRDSAAYPYTDFSDFWKYDSNTDSWTQIADFPGTAKVNAVGFSINGIGYVGTGYNDDTVYYYRRIEK